MKLLMVCQLYYPENCIIYKFAERLATLGHEVDVLTGKPNYGFDHLLPEYKHIKKEIINGVTVNRVNLFARKKSRLSIIFNYLSFWYNSKKWVRRCKTKYDAVYSLSISPVTILAAGNLYKKKHGVPHLVHCVDLWPESTLVTHAIKKDSFAYKILYKWSRALYSHADHIFIGSPSYANYFDKVLKLPTDNLSFLPQPSLIEQIENEPIKFKKGFHILYCGNLGIIQLIPLIPESMKLIKDKSIYFHIIGMGPMSETLIKLIKEYHLEDNVIYHGPIPAKKAASYFKSADALYVSLEGSGTVGKTIPNKLMMSMVFQKPILGVLKGDGKEVLESAKGGVIAEPNSKSVKDAILYLASLSKEEKEAMGLNNSSYYKKHFSIDKIVNELNDYLVNKCR